MLVPTQKMNLFLMLLLYFMGQGVGVDGAGDSVCIWQGQRLGEWFQGAGKRTSMV